MTVEGGAKCVKYLLFFFNFIFWVCGLALIVLGILAMVSINSTGLLKGYTGAPLLLIIVGVVIFFIAFFGCCGAWKENQCMVTTFAIILSLIVITEIGAGIAGYVMREKVSSLLDQGFKEMIAGYNKTTKYRDALDSMQQEVKCCGANSSADWGSFSAAGNSVPDSCCKNMTLNCGVGNMQNSNIIYTNGCQAYFEKLVKDNVLWFAVAAIVIAFIQITGIALACILSRAIRSGYEVM